MKSLMCWMQARYVAHGYGLAVVVAAAVASAGCTAVASLTMSPTVLPKASSVAATTPGAVSYQPGMCLNNTQDGAVCKDCCDALDTDADGRKTCRDACAVHDFAQNTSFITITVKSTQGPTGDYSACTLTGSQSTCKVCCDSSNTIENGDRRFCRDACNLMTDDRGAGQEPANQKPPAQKPAGASILSPVAGTYQFTEGPVADAQGNITFSDITAGRIYRWATSGHVSVFVSGLQSPNGLALTHEGVLVACEGGAGRLVTIDAQGNVMPLIASYNGKRFNAPNDLWIDAQGGIYFTDPVYQATLVQDGEYVYYLSPDHGQVTRVISDMVRPNGIVGTSDGKTLYVADHGAGKTYAYTITSAGVLAEKRLFAANGSDGMTLDKSGHVYLTTGNTVLVYDVAGQLIRTIPVPEPPTNVEFGGVDGNTLFITARSSVYTMTQ